MNSTTPTPSTPPPWPAPPAPPSTQPPARTWPTPSLSAAGWLAATGASLLLVASIIVVAGNWQSIEPEIRFAGLVAALVAIYFPAETARGRLPSTARAMATLAAALTAPVGIAAAATLGQPWPVCTLVGGLAAFGATELQSRRWAVPELKAATVVAYGLFAIGLAALTSTPVALIGALGAVAGLLLGSVRRSTTLAVAVGLTPIVGGLASAGLAPGTVGRLGLTGSVVAWSAPLSCALAAGVLAVIAQRYRNVPLAIGAAATLAIGAVSGLMSVHADAWVWWSLAAITLLGLEALGATRTDSIWRQIARRGSTPVAVGFASVAIVLPYVVLWENWFSPIDHDLAATVPLGLTSLALLATTYGSSRRHGWSESALTASAASLFAALVVAGAPLWLASLAALGCWGFVTATTSWSSWDITTATIASWVLVAEAIDDTSPIWVRAALIGAAGAALVASISIRQRKDGGFRLILAAGTVSLAAAALGTNEPVIVASAMLTAAIALGVSLRPSTSTCPLVLASLIVRATVNDDGAAWSSVVLVELLAIAFAGASRGANDPRRHVAAVLAVVAGALALATAGVDPGTATMAGVVIGAALSGLALVDRRMLPALTAGVATTLAATVASSSASDVFVSIAVTMLGLQLAMAGAEWIGRYAAVPGAALAAVGLASAWWTTGTNAWAIDGIEPYGATGVDLVVGVLVVVLLTAGWIARRTNHVTSWLAYGPGLAFASTWLLASQLETGSDWATFGALLVGIVALGIGGWRRLGAALVVGTILVGGTLLLSAGPRLATTPTWIWIAAGGIGLLVLAAFIERSERPLLPIGRKAHTQRSILEQFCEEFG